MSIWDWLARPPGGAGGQQPSRPRPTPKKGGVKITQAPGFRPGGDTPYIPEAVRKSGSQGATRTLPTGPGGAPAPTISGGGKPRGDGGAAAAAARAAAAAQAAADAAMKAAGNRFRDQAGNLDPQIAALRHALDVSFRQGLDQDLADIGKLVDEQLNMLKTQHGQRALDFLASAENSEKATAQQGEDAISNMVRERQDTMASVLEHGAGQTDQLRALMGAARNWRSNQQEGNRAYFDSIQSVNQGITDLNLDTQTALGNAHTQAESERERMWKDFHNRRSETFTQIGNLYQQQADLHDQAKEMKVGGGGGEKKTKSGESFMEAAKEAGKSYVRQGLPDWIKDYKGQARVQAQVSNTNLSAAPTIKQPKGPKGAQLRRWAA